MVRFTNVRDISMKTEIYSEPWKKAEEWLEMKHVTENKGNLTYEANRFRHLTVWFFPSDEDLARAIELSEQEAREQERRKREKLERENAKNLFGNGDTSTQTTR